MSFKQCFVPLGSHLIMSTLHYTISGSSRITPLTVITRNAFLIPQKRSGLYKGVPAFFLIQYVLEPLIFKIFKPYCANGACSI